MPPLVDARLAEPKAGCNLANSTSPRFDLRLGSEAPLDVALHDHRFLSEIHLDRRALKRRVRENV